MTNDIYKVLKNDTFGRYMAAGKNIRAGELILTEKPVLLGPQIDGPLICFNCCKNLRSTGYTFCRKCKTAVICSPKCTGSLHTPEECFVLEDPKINGEVLVDHDQIAFPLRCLLLRNYKPEIWKQILELEPHVESRRHTPIWRRHQIMVEVILRKLGIVSDEELKGDLVQKICGILDVNTFEVRPSNNSSGIITNPEVQCLRGLYLKAALMAHDCMANTHMSVDDDFVLTLHASVDILENTPIFFNYSNVLHGSADRKQYLREGKYFECSCTRCRDPTELGTEISSLKCHKCGKGLIRQKEPEKAKSDWACTQCKHTFKNCLINSTIEEGRRKMEDIDQTNVLDMEMLLHKLLQTFHPNHFLMLEIQQNILGSYVNLPPNKKHLSRKITLCQGLLEVFSKIEIGISRIKGITLYEMQFALIDLAHKQYRDKEINAEELIVKLLSAETTLKEAIKNLLYEPLKSPEGRMAQIALSELKMLRLSVNNIQRDYLFTDSDLKKNKNVRTGTSRSGEVKSDVTSAKNGGKVDISDTIPATEASETKTKRRRNRKKK